MHPAEPDPRDVEELERHLLEKYRHRVKHPKPKPVPPPPPKPSPSWAVPGPIIFTAWDSSAARKGPWTVATIVEPGVAPIWQCGPGIIAQAESQDQVAHALDWFDRTNAPKALVATQGGWAPAKPFLDEGINVCLVEAYQNEDPSHTPAQLTWQAQHDGWPYAWPVVGCYHGYPLADYDLAAYGHNFGIWLAEEMSQDDWDTLARLCS